MAKDRNCNSGAMQQQSFVSAKKQFAPRKLESSSYQQINTGGSIAYDGKIAGLYDLEETLGSGHFAVVKMARHVFTGAKVAVKVVDKTKLDDISRAHLFQEVRCMKLVQHPNVVRLYEVIDTQTKLYLVLELGDGGDLYDYIMKHDGGLNEDLARKYFRQILRAITYCHQLHVVHRDLKPENVVFFEKLGVVKLTDFGFSNKFSPGQKLQTFCGSLAYSAPEILLGDSYDAPAVDIWSLGVILYMLVCGQPPFEKANDSETLTMIMDCKYTIPAQISKNCHRLIGSMLVRDPKKRASLEQIAKDPWLEENQQNDAQQINDFMPLVSREEINEDDHTFIIQKMINGNIATKEDIIQALDKDQYNHITATYFLLAEMRLRKRREELHFKQNLSSLPVNVNKNLEKIICNKPASDVKIMRVPNIVCIPDSTLPTEIKTEKRTRKCSIVREEEEEESAHDSYDGNELKVGINPRRESISDGRLNRSVQEKTPTVLLNVKYDTTNRIQQEPNNSNQRQNSHNRINNMNINKLMVLKNVNTNLDADLEKQMDKLNLKTTPTIASSAMVSLESAEIRDTLKGLDDVKLKTHKNSVLGHRRHNSKLNKIRTPSCSSSEASDDDTKTRNKKKIHKLVGDTPVRFRMHRRDSHDDSSDSQDQNFSPSNGPAASDNHGNNTNTTGNTNNLIISSNIRSKSGQQQQRQQQQQRRPKECYGQEATTNREQYFFESNPSSKFISNLMAQERDTIVEIRISPNKSDTVNTNIDINKSYLLKNKLNLELEQSLKNTTTNNRRLNRPIRESHSLDRISEAQEYDFKRDLCHILRSNQNLKMNRVNEEEEEDGLVVKKVEKVEEKTYNNKNCNINSLLLGRGNLLCNVKLLRASFPKITGSFNNLYNEEQRCIQLTPGDEDVRKNRITLLNELKNDNISIYNLKSIDEIDLIWNKKYNLTRKFHQQIIDAKENELEITNNSSNSAKYLVTMKKIRKLGKYFPAINIEL